MKGNTDLLKADIGKIFFRYCIPSIAGVVSVASYIFFDTMFIGQGVGAEGLAALNIVLPLYNLFNALAFLFGMGGATVLSISKGKNDKEAEHKVFTYSLVMGIISGAILTLICLVCLDNIAMFLGANSENINLVKEYMRIIMIMPIGFILNPMLSIFIRNDKAPQLAMWSMILSSLSNIILDYILVFPLGMGMKGAALATFVSPIVGIIIISTHFTKKSCTLKLNFNKVDFGILKRLILGGIPSFIMEMSGGIVIFAFNITIHKYLGNLGISAYSIIANIGLIFVSIFNGIAQAAQPIISINHGAKLEKRVLKLLKISDFTALVFGVVFFMTGMLFPKILIRIFSKDLSLIDITTRGIYLYFIAFIFMGINIITTIYFQSIENHRASTIMSISRGIGGILLGLLMIPMILEVDGVWLTVPFAEIITFIIGISILFSKKQFIKEFK